MWRLVDLLGEGFFVGEGGALLVVVGIVTVWCCSCLGDGRTSLVKNKISERQLLSFIER